MNKLFKTIAITAFSIFTLAACSPDTSEKPVKILYPSWAEGVAMTNLAEYVLTDKGIAVETTLIEPGPLYATLAKGDADLYLDAWLPNTHADYWKRFGDKLEIIGVVFDDASSGLAVPTYVDINSIEELNANRAMFDGKIYGIGAGAGLHGNTIKAIEQYPLDYTQITSSESSMMAELRRAVAANEPIIITAWKPHYMWDIYDLKLLEDPKNLFPKEEIRILSRQNFKADRPEVAAFFEKFQLNSDQLHELMRLVGEDDRNPQAGAKKFYELHKAEIDTWFE